jgi:hypothetical protein
VTSSVLVVPGAAVRGYVRPAVDALQGRGIDARLLPAPGEPGVPPDLADYGRMLAARIRADGGRDPEVAMIIGLSVGTQAAVVAADSLAAPTKIGRLMLVGPTVDPTIRSGPRLLARWLAGGRVERPGLLREQLPDWRRAGPRRIAAVVRSARSVVLEDLVPRLQVPFDVVHAEDDLITSHAYAAQLATVDGGRLILVPGATHSWPNGDPDRFAALVAGVLADGTDGDVA